MWQSFFQNICNGKIAAITGAKKFKEKAIKKLLRVIEIFKSVSNSSFITSFILFKINKLDNNAKMKAGIEKRIHWNNIIKITFFFEFPTSLKTPNSNELVSVVSLIVMNVLILNLIQIYLIILDLKLDLIKLFHI